MTRYRIKTIVRKRKSNVWILWLITGLAYFVAPSFAEGTLRVIVLDIAILALMLCAYLFDENPKEVGEEVRVKVR